jgi:2,4-diketo-3-deoxy-L-fuconate hydrolase
MREYMCFAGPKGLFVVQGSAIATELGHIRVLLRRVDNPAEPDCPSALVKLGRAIYTGAMLQVVRYRNKGSAQWGVVRADEVVPVPRALSTTQEILTRGLDSVRETAERGGPGVPLDKVQLLSPITENQQVICQAKNYRAHAVEMGTDPEAKTFNMLFRKASSCLCGAYDDIIRPGHVRLLDYEVELGLVIGRELPSPRRFEGDTLPDAVGALVIHNDVSARDIQLPQSQFYKGKSYRSFGPTGPYLTLVDERLRARWPELRLQLRVNGELRQNALCEDMLYKPSATLTELLEIQSLQAGDLIATGTPAGVALQRSAEQDALLAGLAEREKWAKLIELQAGSGRYLKPGDLVEVTIRSDDGSIDLGALRNRVVAA